MPAKLYAQSMCLGNRRLVTPHDLVEAGDPGSIDFVMLCFLFSYSCNNFFLHDGLSSFLEVSYVVCLFLSLPRPAYSMWRLCVSNDLNFQYWVDHSFLFESKAADKGSLLSTVQPQPSQIKERGLDRSNSPVCRPRSVRRPATAPRHLILGDIVSVPHQYGTKKLLLDESQMPWQSMESW